MTITDDDIAPTISLGDLTSAETAGAKNLVATFQQPLRGTITVDYATSDFTATAGLITPLEPAQSHFLLVIQPHRMCLYLYLLT